MEKLPLSLKLKDAIRIHIKTNLIPSVIGIGIAMYTQKENLESIIVIGIPLLIVLFSIVIFITYKSAYMTLTESGITYQDWRGRELSYLWSQPIDVYKSNKENEYSHSIKLVSVNKNIKVPKTIISYPEVRSFISKFPPENHKIRDLVASDS